MIELKMQRILLAMANLCRIRAPLDNFIRLCNCRGIFPYNRGVSIAKMPQRSIYVLFVEHWVFLRFCASEFDWRETPLPHNSSDLITQVQVTQWLY